MVGHDYNKKKNKLPSQKIVTVDSGPSGSLTASFRITHKAEVTV